MKIPTNIEHADPCMITQLYEMHPQVGYPFSEIVEKRDIKIVYLNYIVIKRKILDCDVIDGKYKFI